MARAAARLTNEPITENAIRELNARLGIEADDETVTAVVRAAR
jgi:ribosomal protein L12E/L44/L45/RPP1/RPP2